jgi:hypothetical protein
MAAGGWSLADEFIMYQGKIFMSTSSQWWPIILAEAHGTGHEGAEKHFVGCERHSTRQQQ